ncbi:MAG: hypothetical protein ACKOAC_04420 [Fluviibacter sp.]
MDYDLRQSFGELCEVQRRKLISFSIAELKNDAHEDDNETDACKETPCNPDVAATPCGSG